MDTSWQLFGFGAVKAALRNVAEKVPENARKVMHRGADRIEKLAKLQCPHDTGDLEESIRQETTYEAKGRLAIDVLFGGEVNGSNVDDYGLEVHENYENMPGIATHGPGKNTLAKMAENPGVLIGSKFLTRALETVEPKLRLAIIDALVETIGKEGLDK